MAEAHVDGPHWRFALSLYKRPGVASACLLLQDSLGLDVNVLLMGLYAVLIQKAAFNRKRAESLDAAGKAIRDEIVVPLRRIRRQMKGRDYGIASESLRNRIKEVELRAEQTQQAALAAHLGQWQAESMPTLSAHRTVVLIAAYFADDDPETLTASLSTETADAIATIAAAAEFAAGTHTP